MFIMLYLILLVKKSLYPGVVRWRHNRTEMHDTGCEGQWQSIRRGILL